MGWQAAVDQRGRRYYYSRAHLKTQWARPPAASPARANPQEFPAPLPSLPYEMWEMVLGWLRRDDLGPPA